MDTMSKIQKQRLLIESLGEFQTALNSMMDKYLIEDSIFIYKNSSLFEVTKGYFVQIGESEDLKEVLSMIKYEDYNKVGIRVLENEKFQLGWIKSSLYECSNDETVFDIDRMLNIR
jgi:hypothetical protein